MSTKDLDKRLEGAFKDKTPKPVSRVVTRRGTDSTGDRAIWVWVILKDEDLLQENRRAEIEELRDWAKRAAESVSDDWAYVTFRTEAEQREVEATKE